MCDMILRFTKQRPYCYLTTSSDKNKKREIALKEVWMVQARAERERTECVSTLFPRILARRGSYMSALHCTRSLSYF